MPAQLILESVGQRLWGFKPRLMAHIVGQHGRLKSLRWFASNMPTYERILMNWGPVRTHIISTTISLINGCAYCSFGHAYSFQLHYLKNTNTLFPLSDEAVLELSSLPPQQIVQRLCSSLESAGLEKETSFVKRTAALMDNTRGTQPTAVDGDAYIIHLIGMFKMLNACGINGNVEPDEAHDPINKNKPLIERYQNMRAASKAQI